MKSRLIYKTIQLVIFVVLAVFSIVLIFSQTNVFHQVADDPNMMVLCIILWAVFIFSFIFIYIDLRFFLKYRKDYKEMSFAVNTDPTTGLENRHSCDAIIEKYIMSGRTEGYACVMIDLMDVGELNAKYGHEAGNVLLRDFSSILRSAAPAEAFLGRNGGNRFLIILDPCEQATLDKFINDFAVGVATHNTSGESTYRINYSWGYSFNDEVPDFAGMVSLATKRIKIKGA